MSTPVGNLTSFYKRRLATNTEVPADETCSICLETYGSGHRAVRVCVRECMHVFGRACLHSWVVSGNPRSNCCPICRTLWYAHDTDLNSPRDLNTSGLMESLDRFSRHGQAISEAINLSRDRTSNQEQELSQQIQFWDAAIIQVHLDTISRRLDLIEQLEDVITALPQTIQDELSLLEARMRQLSLNSRTRGNVVANPRQGALRTQTPTSLEISRGTTNAIHTTQNPYLEAFVTDPDAEDRHISRLLAIRHRPHARPNSPFPRSETTQQQNTFPVSFHPDSFGNRGASSYLRRVQVTPGNSRISFFSRVARALVKPRSRSNRNSSGRLSMLAEMENCERLSIWPIPRRNGMN